jgi:hypothetical protein
MKLALHIRWKSFFFCEIYSLKELALFISANIKLKGQHLSNIWSENPWNQRGLKFKQFSRNWTYLTHLLCKVYIDGTYLTPKGEGSRWFSQNKHVHIPARSSIRSPACHTCLVHPSAFFPPRQMRRANSGSSQGFRHSSGCRELCDVPGTFTYPIKSSTGTYC